MTKGENIKIHISSTEKEKNNESLYIMFEEKINVLQEIVKKTILSSQRYKVMNLIGANELNVCGQSLETIFSTLQSILSVIKKREKIDENIYIQKLQDIINELSTVFKTYGTETVSDLIQICFGSDFVVKNFTSVSSTSVSSTSVSSTSTINKYLHKYNIMNKYVHPIGYKIMSWKADPTDDMKENILKKNKIIENFMIVESSENLDCFDLARTCKIFQMKVYGIKFSIQNKEQRKTLIVSAIVDDIMLECLNDPYVETRMKTIVEEKPKDPEFSMNSFDRYLQSITLKDLLIYNNQELYNRYIGYITHIGLIKQRTIANVTKDFMASDMYSQRSMIIQLLLKSNEHEFQYLAYLLYDLLSNDLNGNIDTTEQTILFDSFSWNIKKFFREAMKQTINYTNSLSNFDNNKIPLEQQICLMKACDTIKEKAMLKLKEVKSKSEDSGSKARQYLEGLLKIPFGIYKNEPILSVMGESVSIFNNLVNKIRNSQFKDVVKTFKNGTYTSVEMRKYSGLLNASYKTFIQHQMVDNIKSVVMNMRRNALIEATCYINALIKSSAIDHPKLCHSGKKTDYMREHIYQFIDKLIDSKYNVLQRLMEISSHLYLSVGVNDTATSLSLVDEIHNEVFSEAEYKPPKTLLSQDNLIKYIDESLETIAHKNNYVNTFMSEVTTTLDNAVYGHVKAKRQVERIIGQWINGEKSGYCFGFEGPPGVGKTSLAKKGISDCLKDAEGNSRPFSFIAVGGSSNGSTLDGHNYTYVGSTWGRIVDILMETKCMNPIIFIDELDKVSKTEHGKEIIGILTHLIDQTQNDEFQDKYFNGIDLDLSKALFIFSYNDVDSIDKILLDRIHRIKFDHLSLEDKLVITNKHLLPEIYKNMGLEGIINISDEVIEFIIDEYTCEPGVRKLKQMLFDVVGEINLSILKTTGVPPVSPHIGASETASETAAVSYELPIKITCDDIRNKYLKDRYEIKTKKIHDNPCVGLITGLWANAQGRGGVLPIEARFHPSNTFLDMKLTGMQGDVMKESMSVAKTLAWSLLTKEQMIKLKTDNECNQGIHIHVPEGATPKDGPSAGTAITIVLYSLFSNKQIRNDVAITGEICLQGNVTAIGGLDLKILGGIRSGVKRFLFPKENDKDFKDFMEKYGKKDIVKGIEFFHIETIDDAIKLAML
jgi:ATP-dependent Lon protease